MIRPALLRLNAQWRAFRTLCAVRGFRVRSGHYRPAIRQPDWQLIAVVSISLIAIGFLFVDEAAMYWQRGIAPELYHAFRDLTRLGKSEILLVPAGLAVLLLALLPWDRLNNSARACLVQFQLAGLYVFLAVAGSGISNNLIKIMVGRARPRHFETLGPYHFDAPGLTSAFQSFPSGHSTTAGAAAILFLLLIPRLRWVWVALGLWIAASRIVVGAHYPSDAVAGFAYGATFAWLLALWFAKRRLLFTGQGGVIRLPKSRGLSMGKLLKALHMMRQKA